VYRVTILVCLLLVLSGGWAFAQTAESERAALVLARRQAEEAMRRSQQLERQAAAATDEAGRARARAAVTAERIQAAEAEITAAETRIRIIENRRAEQRARLAERQEPVVRLTAALQTMARRPPALALVQPGSLDDVVHVRSLLASTLPIIRSRTASLRRELQSANALRDQAQLAVAALVSGQEELKKQRLALARIEAEQRRRSASLAGAALFESDRALAFNEDAIEAGQRAGTLREQAQVRRALAELPGPMLRPALPGQQPEPPARAGSYLLPVDGRLIAGMGEISDAGVHARGLTFEARSYSAVVAPAAGRIVYAGPFRGYGDIVIIDHGRGLTTLITNLGELAIKVGDAVQRGQALGRTGRGRPRVMVELRRAGVPIAITPLVAGG
jgi:septal ring factor EnvC (AmiA/AmiB activator)